MTIKSQIFTSIVFFLILVSCQSKSDDSETKKDKKGIKKQVRVKGTRMYFYPPDGFVQSQTLNGFINEDVGVAIIFIEYNISIDSLKNDSTKKTFKLLHKENLEVSGFEAEYDESIIWKSGQEYYTQTVLFGTDTNSVMVIASGLTDSISKDVKESFQTLYYDPTLDLGDRNWYTIGNENTRQFKFVSSMQNNHMYAQYSDMGKRKHNEFTFMIRRDFAEVDTSNVSSYAWSNFKQISNFEYYDDIKRNKITINGIKGYEVYGSGFTNEEDREKMVYVVFLHSDNVIYRLVGVALNDFEDYLSLFKEFTNTFKVKGRANN